MPSYRVEEASTGRAGCTNKECKDNKVKIPKGELRFGSWVDNGKFQTFYWRHWGCVTPKTISNVNDVIGEGDERDLDMLDGYEDLSPEIQQKIQRALEQGHVDHEDWKGDRELNEPGKSGFRVRTPKKKAKAGDKEENGEVTEEEEAPKPSKTKKRSRAPVDEDGKDTEAAQPKRAKRKSASTPKKAPISSDKEEEDDDDTFESPEPKARASKRGRQPKESKPAATSGSKRGRKAKKDTEEGAEPEPVAEKPKRGRKKAA